jgi:hypothetical protein
MKNTKRPKGVCDPRSKNPIYAPRNHAFRKRGDLLNWILDHKFTSSSVEELNATTLYAVDCINIWKDYDGTFAIPLIGKRNISWIGQLLNLKLAWQLHGDGKHKLHIGRFVLMTFGCHCLIWDGAHKCYRHTFR